MTETILDRLVAAKRRELVGLMAQAPLAELKARASDMPPTLNLSGALLGDGVRLIAEVKKASPSKGAFVDSYDPASLASTYAENGAAAISVLTEVDHFQGSLSHLLAVKEATAPWRPPVLRKDFLFDPYHVYEARAAGADAILLIVAVLAPNQLKEMLQLAHSVWLQCLVEVHDAGEVETAVEAGAEIIGINNRDLRTFKTDLALTEELASLVPRGKIVVSESGITTPDHVLRVRKAGASAILVGEALMTAPDVGAKVRELLDPVAAAR